MRRIQFDADPSSAGHGIRVIAENFDSAAELVRVCKERKVSPYYSSHAYFNEDLTGGSWDDFEDSNDLIKLVENGVKDQSILDGVNRYARTARVKDEEKLVQRCMDVVGGGVDVPAYLTGVPTCMHSLKRLKVKSKVIKIGIYCHVLCNISAEQYRKAGELITKTVARLEKAGYRIRMRAVDVYEDSGWRDRKGFDGRHTLWMVTHMVKRENEPMNYRRIMFPITRVAYERGLGFAWMAVNGSPMIYGLGGQASRVVSDPGEFEDIIAKGCGEEDYVIFSQDEIIGYIQKNGMEKAQKMVEAKVLGTA